MRFLADWLCEERVVVGKRWPRAVEMERQAGAQTLRRVVRSPNFVEWKRPLEGPSRRLAACDRDVLPEPSGSRWDAASAVV